MIALYLDEDVDILLKVLLSSKGYTVRTAKDEGMLGLTDREQIEHAIGLKSMILTHNRVHFEKIYSELYAEGREHYGIIIASRYKIYELSARISRLLEHIRKTDYRNLIFYV